MSAARRAEGEAFMPERLVSRALLALAHRSGLLAVSACRESGGEGEYFAIGGKIFVFNYRVATATYLVNLVPLQPVEEGQTAVASFEDPAGGEPIVVRQKIWPNMAKTTIESPPLRCVVKDRPYEVSIAIEGPDGAVMQTIETTMASSEDQSHAAGQAAGRRAALHAQSGTQAGHPDGNLPDSEHAAMSIDGSFRQRLNDGKPDRIVRGRATAPVILLRRRTSKPAKHCSFWMACDFV